VYTVCKNAQNGKEESEKEIIKMASSTAYLRVQIAKGAIAHFSYSLDGEKFIAVNESFQAETGRWIGAKVGLFCTRTEQTNDSGYGDFDWFRVEPATRD
jgi:hypothetical protein